MSLAGPRPPQGLLHRLAAHPAVRIVLPLLIVALAVYVLHRLSREVHWRDVQAALAVLPVSAMLTALACTAGSYVALSLYDVFTLRVLAPGKVPPRLAAVAGASGFAISNLLGASWLTGSAVRALLYATLGVDLGTIAHVIGMTWLGFLSGLALGLLLSFHPAGLGAMLPIGPGTETVAGLALLAGLGLVFARLGLGQQAYRIGPLRIELPPLRLALPLTMVALVDMILASATLYVLLSPDLGGNYAVFFVVYVSAVALGVLSHAPGGIGVFEAALVAGPVAVASSERPGPRVWPHRVNGPGSGHRPPGSRVRGGRCSRAGPRRWPGRVPAPGSRPAAVGHGPGRGRWCRPIPRPAIARRRCCPASRA